MVLVLKFGIKLRIIYRQTESCCIFEGIKFTIGMAGVFLLLGSNRGDRKEMISQATGEIGNRIGETVKTSSIYETEPWGYNDPESFLNQVLVVETTLNSGEVLNQILEIESGLGRTRTIGKITGRTMDIDILFYDNLVLHSGLLIIPHPRLHLRRFTLVPLVELDPGKLHPVFNRTVEQLLNECEDQSEVKKYFAVS